VEKKSLRAAIIIFALLFLVAVGTHFVNLGKANPYFEYRATSTPIVSIQAPINGTVVNAVLLNFTVRKPEGWAGEQGVKGLLQYLSSVVIEIDGEFYGRAFGFDRNLSSLFDYSTCIAGLTEGLHNLTVRANAYGFSVEMHGLWEHSIPINSSSTVYFTFDTTPPTVSVEPIVNETFSEYEVSEIPLKFTVDETVSEIRYSLDGQENVTIAGNTTLANLPYGEHNVTIYATDEVGNTGASEIIVFTVEEPESFPTNMVIAPAASVAFVGAGLLFYFKKRQKARDKA
jgi:hypothetical protein